ncbi:MAG: transglycosylase domain-containing protein, partial [Alphaproteobacteria bacterium]|nr:transglycosylase domain-containing protein [Alphaproteobacteria bacterium]
MRILRRILPFFSTTAVVLLTTLTTAVVAVIAGSWYLSWDLPDSSQLANYEPAVTTRVHAANGSLLGEYAKQRRFYLPIQTVPKLVINSFLTAEDRNFYQHGGLDYTGMARAIYSYVAHSGSNQRTQGASTITQQVARTFFLTPSHSATRKIKEALLARRLEATLSKDRILELYLNQIYLGVGSYGIAAASLAYFDKSVSELTVAEAAFLAALPKMPSMLHPVRNHDRAVERRDYVIDRLLENNFITPADADKARKEPLAMASRRNDAHTFAGEYFAEEVRRDILERYGETKLYEGGLSVHSTLDPKLQVMARKAMVTGLVNFDQSQGYRGAITKVDISG